MKKNVKISSVAGIVLFALAALFSISLISVLFDFGGQSPAHDTYLYQFGKMFAGVYGWCSALIPIFLLVAAIQCFTSTWRTRTGVLLLGSVIPFFTLDAVEHICRMSYAENSGDIFIIKLCAALVTGAIIVAVEYLVLSIIGEALESKEKKSEFDLSELEIPVDFDENSEMEFIGEDLDLNKSGATESVNETKVIYVEPLKINKESEAPNQKENFSLVQENQAPFEQKDENEEDNPFKHIFDNQDFSEPKIDEENFDDKDKVSADEFDSNKGAENSDAKEQDGSSEAKAQETSFNERTQDSNLDKRNIDSNVDEGEQGSNSIGDESTTSSLDETLDSNYDSTFDEDFEIPDFFASEQIDENDEADNATQTEQEDSENAGDDDFDADWGNIDMSELDGEFDSNQDSDTQDSNSDEGDLALTPNQSSKLNSNSFVNDSTEAFEVPDLTEEFDSAKNETPFDEFDYSPEVKIIENRQEPFSKESENLDDVKNYFSDDEEVEESNSVSDLDLLAQEDVSDQSADDEDLGEPVDVIEEFESGALKATEEVLDYAGEAPTENIVPEIPPSVQETVPEEKYENPESFGDATFSSEISDGEQEDDLSDFVEERNSSFDKIFSEMGEDAARNPVESKTATFDDDFDSLFDESDLEKGIDKELDVDYTVRDDTAFDPMHDPAVDTTGFPFGTSIPFDTEDISFEDVVKAKKSMKPNSNQNDENSHPAKNLVLNDSAVASKKVENEKIEDDTKDFKPATQQVLSGATSALNSADNAVEKSRPKLKLSNYKIPTEGILTTYTNGEYWIIDGETKNAAQDLKETLKEFNIEAEVTGIRKGPVVTMFEILPAPGVKLSKIVALQDNIALRLAASSVRIVAPIPGKHAVGIEVPNKDRSVVSFKEIVEQKNPSFEKMAVPVILGKDISGEPQIIDLAKTPHLLIAGSTGAGKSVCVNSMILSILYKRSPQQVKLILIDPKIVELKLYNDIPHLLTPVITEPKKALQALQYCLCEMERRYALLDGMGVRDITSYNRRIVERKICQEKLPYIVIIIDEFADLMATTGKELESNVARLAAMSRAVGIHLVLATQRPSVNVITGLIKANIPSRIAFMVASRTDSNIIIDSVGAEKLLGKGDMLYASATDPYPTRIQGTLVSDDEVEKVVDYVKQYGEPDYIDDEIFVEDDDDIEGGPGLFSDGEDPLYDQALQIVVQAGKASASYIQRRLKIGYNRAARLVEEMEERGIVGPANGSKPREVISMP